jgi:hypothetical protein
MAYLETKTLRHYQINHTIIVYFITWNLLVVDNKILSSRLACCKGCMMADCIADGIPGNKKIMTLSNLTCHYSIFKNFELTLMLSELDNYITLFVW